MMQEEYDQDLVDIENLLVPLITKCKEKNRAIRIGTPYIFTHAVQVYKHETGKLVAFFHVLKVQTTDRCLLE